tara:strand:- start:836 stop:1486 length:651 start_codon:yes stop_codon:yes gene_type:complete
MLNNYTDQIYCLNLKKRIDRKQRFLKRLKNEAQTDTSKLTFVEAVDGNQLDYVPYPFDKGWPEETAGAYGCLQSHLKAIKDAKEKKFKTILIFEDDVTFRANFIPHLQLLFDNIPTEWESLFIGANFQTEQVQVNPFLSTSTAVGAHAYFLRDSLFDNILDWGTTLCNMPIDVFYCKSIHSRPTNFFSHPRICSQEAGTSDIEQRDVDHRSVLGNF